MGDLLSFATLAALIFVGYKFTFSTNALILLSLMQRSIIKEFWKFSSVELITSSAASVAISYIIIFNEDRVFASIIFMVSTLSYIIYMIDRVWRLSETRENS